MANYECCRAGLKGKAREELLKSQGTWTCDKCGRRWAMHAEAVEGMTDDIIRERLDRRDKLRKAGQAALDWAEDTGSCLFCDMSKSKNKGHEEWCALFGIEHDDDDGGDSGETVPSSG